MSIEPNPVAVHGKFFSRSGQKFFLKAVRIEHLETPIDFSRKVSLRDRFEKLHQAHTTCLIVEEEPADAVIGLAAQVGLCSMVEIKVAPGELLEARSMRAVRARIEKTVRSLCGRHGLVGYLIDCPLSRALLKAHGLETFRRRLCGLVTSIRRVDGRSLVSIKHRPSTRATALLDENLLYSIVPPLSPTELREYIIGLHNLAEARPIVIEFEQSSADQDDLVACAFGLGAAGVVAPLVRRSPNPGLMALRVLRAEELMPFLTLNGSCPPPPVRTPMVSVVICAYNAERTMRPCLESLRKLDYPNYEVVIVDDGSRDRTAEIAMDFPEFRLIRQPNKGLSVARNVGMRAANGEIIAYTDSDCVVDPHWLKLMVRAMADGAFDGCGGPNYAPHEDGRIEACVAASPGAPCHVLTGEDRAEHLAGCNMIYSKSALLAVGGFDPQFTAAGDDVDICWRLIAAGYSLGFCPAAFVWHFRRNTVKAYYGQQRGYGRAEAMLYAKYPERFNALGQIKWQGTIPGLARTLPGGGAKRVLWAASRPGIQTVYDPALGLPRFLPQTLEWNLAAALATLASIAGGFSPLPALAILLLGPIWALHYAWQAPLEKCHQSFTSRLFVAWLAYTGPMFRTITRYKMRLNAAIKAGSFAEAATRQRAEVSIRQRSFRLAYWNEAYISRDNLLERLVKLFARSGHPLIRDQGWNDFDLEVRPGPWTRVELKTADEEHGGLRLKNLVLARVRMSRLSKIGLLTGALASLSTAALGMFGIAAALATLTIAGVGFVASQGLESGQLAYRAVEQCAEEIGLMPLGVPTARVERPAQAARAPSSARHIRSAELLADNSPLAE